MPPFIPGLELNRRFYNAIVRPLLDAHFPSLPHAAARIGWGSDVLGFDTEMSTDHGWGPQLDIFLRQEDRGQAGAIHDLLADALPHEFLGYSVGFVLAEDGNSHIPAPRGTRPLHHLITVSTFEQFIHRWLAYTPGDPLTVADWLTFPAQTLRALTAGAVYHDGLGTVTALRDQLAYYPHDVWLYLLAAGWARIGQEEHLMPRAGYVGDELGSTLIGARLVRDVMSLAFLMEKQYAPYPKWFGTAFSKLPCAPTLTPFLWNAQQATIWETRMTALANAYQVLGVMHNALGITPPLDTAPQPFHDRPFMVSNADRFVAAIVAIITDPAVRRLADKPLIGNIDQFSDSTDLRAGSEWREVLKGLYE